MMTEYKWPHYKLQFIKTRQDYDKFLTQHAKICMVQLISKICFDVSQTKSRLSTAKLIVPIFEQSDGIFMLGQIFFSRKILNF